AQQVTKKGPFTCLEHKRGGDDPELIFDPGDGTCVTPPFTASGTLNPPGSPVNVQLIPVGGGPPINGTVIPQSTNRTWQVSFPATVPFGNYILRQTDGTVNEIDIQVGNCP